MSEKLIAAIAVNDLTDIRVRLDCWRGRRRLDIRIFMGPAAARRPTEKGLAIPPGLIDALLYALKTARAESAALGWIADDGGPT